MKEIIIWVLVLVLIFISFGTTLIYGLIKKKRVFVYISIAIFFVLIGCALRTGYLFINKSVNRFSKMEIGSRTGPEIYTALFGKTDIGCLKVINYQDQIIPKIDYAIWLEFETCPQELKRILQLRKYASQIQSTAGLNTEGPGANNNWFNPESLGSSVLVFEYKEDDYGNGQKIYTSLDSTKAFCIDILD